MEPPDVVLSIFFKIVEPTIMVNEMLFQTYGLSSSRFFDVWKGGGSSCDSNFRVKWHEKMFFLLPWWVDRR